VALEIKLLLCRVPVVFGFLYAVLVFTGAGGRRYGRAKGMRRVTLVGAGRQDFLRGLVLRRVRVSRRRKVLDWQSGMGS
jgi:hypothetical protein